MVSAVALSLVMNLFTGPGERARAMGVYGFVGAGGGSIGVLAGGLLTGTLDWHWVFLVNLPIGALVVGLSLFLLPADREPETRGRLDVAGALTVTASLTLAVYAIVNGNASGWGSAQTTGLLIAAAALMGAFLWIESGAGAPLMPLGLFRLRNLSVSNIAGVLWAAGMFAWFFLSALYLQLVLGYTPFQVGMAFLPANLIMAVFSLGLSARMVMRFGIRPSLASGLSLVAAGLLLLARAPVHGTFAADILPGMIVLGFGCGISFNPLLLAAMGDAPPGESGLASGVVNTAFMMGGALGLAVLASLAESRTARLLEAGSDRPAALAGGYQAAFLAGAVCAAGAALCALLLRPVPAGAASEEVVLREPSPAEGRRVSAREA